ncbi:MULTISPECIES: FAD-dependent monooxygenase [unclassified Nocardioides]|uniref:FAD-dependent monooxygenase n=1 Tax=unclassified Nocardioides TaxID=2615069 RepID=UPI0009E74D8B|nr:MULTISPECIES: FAD-dependent monooxygenase [unclassified Nocardioides]
MQQTDVDVLVVGTGPAGLVLAAQLARFPSIRTRVVERRDGPLELGQADGVACRTLEMLRAFGIAGRVMEEAYWVNETRFWRPDAGQDGGIVRSGRVQDVADGLSEMPHVILNQARVHDHLLDQMRASGLEPTYGAELVDLVVPDGPGPVTATLRDVRTGATESVRASYVVGCDGARSRVREAIGRQLHGDRADHAWGVLDVFVDTDFPDIRFKAAIQSAGHGSILLIPREGGRMVRLYVDLGTVTPDNRDAIRTMTPDDVAAVAQRVLQPYTIEVRETVWFSVYEVAQRIADGFDDGVGRGRAPRVFIAGDACHTHSAKAGQGMNVSMQDAFNLGWKLAAVLEGRADADLLTTYDEERRPVAQELIDFDREWQAMLASPPSEQVADYFVRQGRYTAGVATHYPAGRLVGTDEHQHLAAGFVVGTRFHSAPVTRIADGRRVELGHAATADGRWRLYAFAGADLDRWRSAIGRLDGGSLDVIGVVPGDSHTTEDLGLPVARDHAYAATTGGRVGEEDIFDLRGVDPERGALVLVRPDQYVAQVLPLDGSQPTSRIRSASSAREPMPSFV